MSGYSLPEIHEKDENRKKKMKRKKKNNTKNKRRTTQRRMRKKNRNKKTATTQTHTHTHTLSLSLSLSHSLSLSTFTLTLKTQRWFLLRHHHLNSIHLNFLSSLDDSFGSPPLPSCLSLCITCVLWSLCFSTVSPFHTDFLTKKTPTFALKTQRYNETRSKSTKVRFWSCAKKATSNKLGTYMLRLCTGIALIGLI